MNEPETKSLLLGLDNPRDSFVSALISRLRSSDQTQNIVDTTCDNSHPYSNILCHIAARFFNVMSVNLVREMNDVIHQSRKRDASSSKENQGARKISKLQSEAS